MDTCSIVSLVCTALAVLCVWAGLIVETVSPRLAQRVEPVATRIAQALLVTSVALLMYVGLRGSRTQPAPAALPTIKTAPDDGAFRRLPPLPHSGEWIDLESMLGKKARVRVY